MTTNPTDSAPGPGAAGEGTEESRTSSGRPSDHLPGDLGALRRSSVDRHIAGVAGGLARHLDIDPIIIRVALVVLVFFGGAGLLLYAAAWLLVPRDDEPAAAVRLDERSRAFLLYLVGGVAVLMLLGDTLGHRHVPWPLFVVGVVVVVLLAGRERRLVMPRRRPRSPEEAAYRERLQAEYAARAEAQARARVEERLSRRFPDPDSGQPMTPWQAPINPRKRGPILFWFTLALIAVAEGVLGLVDVAGAAIEGPAYAALAVGVIGVMLVVGAFWGRAGGLVLLGLVATMVLAGSLAANKWQLDRHGHDVTYAPTSSATVKDSYRFGTGDLRVDLSRVADPAALAGRTIEVGGHAGNITVVVPATPTTAASGTVHGPGVVEIFGHSSGGISTTVSGTSAQNADQLLTIDAELNVGRITVETSDE